MRLLLQPWLRKTVSLVVIFSIGAIVALLAGAVMAKGEVPPTYVASKNPFAWDDKSVQAQGKSIYGQSCIACHGAEGRNYANANFSVPEFSAQLETDQDYYFWIVSEGRMASGMPPFKSKLSETERWQTLTYVWSLSKPTEIAPSAVASGPSVKPGNLALTISENSFSSSPLLFTASLSDQDGKPIKDKSVTFFLKKSFFVTDLVEIGQAATNNEGKAELKYSPSERGEIQVLAREGKAEATASWTVTRASSYQAEAGIHLPTLGSGLAEGTQLSVDPVQMNESPRGSFRLPGGGLSWLLLFVAVIIVIWTTYFRVFRQLMLIPEAGRHEGLSVKVVPIGAMLFVLVVGTVLAVVLLRGPNTHLHLIP